MFKDLVRNGTKFSHLRGECQEKIVWKVWTKRSFALYHQDTVQKGEPASHTRLKNMVKKYLEQKTNDRNFDARNDRTASGAPIRRKGDE